ncbi:MAG: hypothetical protein AAF636_25200 [Pseudomonadota bacterium]
MQNLDDMLTPEEWCKKLRKTGAVVSARALRTKAREHGQYYSIGRAMMLSAKQLETLMSLDASSTEAD